MTTSDQESSYQESTSSTEAQTQTAAADELQLEADRQRLRADEAEERIAELERQLQAARGPAASEPTASDASSLEQQHRPPVLPAERAMGEAFPTAPTAGDAASLVQQEPPVTPPGPELTPAQEHSVDQPPAGPHPAEDPLAAIAAGGHLDAAGQPCFCDRGGGHAPLDPEEAATVSQPTSVAPATTEPLSADERAELEQLRAERAARTGA